MEVSPAKRTYFTCANVWWKLLFHSTILLLNPTKANTLHSLTESLSRLASKKDGASKRLLTNLARALPLFPGKFDAI